MSDSSPLFYQAATLGFNYFEFGPIRRGLGGTVAYLLGDDPLLNAVLFHMLAAIAVAAGVSVLFYRLKAPPAKRLVFALVSLIIMLRWANDVGRTDMAIAALLAGATLAFQKGRLGWATAAICVGLFVHESALIFGGPLLVALMLRRGTNQGYARSTIISTAVVVTIALGAYSFISFSQVDTLTIANMVRGKFGSQDSVDWAVYYALSGTRGVATSICQNWTDPDYWMHPFGAIVVLIFVYVALNRQCKSDIPILLIATIPPLAVLCVVANDAARWTLLAAFNLGLVSASMESPEKTSNLARWSALAAAVILLPLTSPYPGKLADLIYLPLTNWTKHPIWEGSPLTEWMLRKANAPRTPEMDKVLETCDPDWRRVIEGSRGAPKP